MSVFPRLYRMTIASSWYDSKAEFARELELHFKSSRRGPIRGNRRALARRGVAYYQRAVYRRYGRWIPKRKLRVNFEREEQTAAVQRAIEVYTRSMRYKGKSWSATALPSKVISDRKRRRKGAKKHA